MLRVGLTGSIAVGKSYVCSVLAENGCHVLDADSVAREVVKAGSAGLESIVKHFGPNVLDETGGLDRSKLGAIVFSDPAKRQLLNSIVHPLVINAQDLWLSEMEKGSRDGIAVIDAALMIESGGYKRFDKLIVVWCRPDIQLNRLMLRDGLSEIEARKRIDAQMPQEEKKSYADFLIDTSGEKEETRAQTLDILRELRSLELYGD